MTPNEIAEAARLKIHKNPETEIPMRKHWATVEDRISEHMLSSKKKWKVYEVTNLTRAARLEMLTRFVDGCTPEDCAKHALSRVGLA